VSLVLVLGVVAALAGGPSAAAQTAPPPPPPDPQLLAVAVELSHTSTRLDVVAAAVSADQSRLAAAQAAYAQIDQEAVATQAQIDQLQSQIAGRAAQVYEQHSNVGAVLQVQHTEQVAVGEQYTDAAGTDDVHQLAQLNAAEAQLDQERAQGDALRQSITTDEQGLQATQASLEAVRSRDEAILSQAGAIPIMGTARLTAPQVAGWFKSTGAVAHLADGTTIDELAQMYIQEGSAEGVAGDVAFAQAVLETGSFGHALDSNFAGIGACDSCTSEIAFPTPRDGVRAQIQLLKSYADPGSRAAQLANPPEPALFGSPAAAAASYDSFAYKGAAPVWNVMGNGKWATDPDYATKVLEIYARMIAYGATHTS
jgi:cell division protein FtsB